MKQIDFVTLLKPYASGWVAISSDFTEVVLWGETLRELKEKVKHSKEQLYFFPAGESYGNFIGLGH